MPDQNSQAVLIDVHQLIPLILTYGLDALWGLIILLIGLWAAGKIDLLVVRALDRTPHFDEMLKRFLASIARYLVLIVTGVAVLSRFGIETTSLVAVLGAAGLAIGLALQGTLSNLAAGVMLLLNRPFSLGQRVQIGSFTGAVKNVSLFWTELVNDDKVQILVPNSTVWGQALQNFSIYPRSARTAEAHFRIAETGNLDEALAAVESVVRNHPGVLNEPAPTVLFDRTPTENELEIVITFATAVDATAAVKSDLIRQVHDRLAAEPIR